MGHGKKPPRPKPGQAAPTEDARKNPPSPVHTKIRLSFEYYDSGSRYCLSHCDAEQTCTFLDCLRKLCERTWQQLLEGTSKNPAMRTGLNATRYVKSDLRNPDIWPTKLAPDVGLVGVRATERRRVFGARFDNVFHVLWFDEGHDVVDG